MPHAWNPAIAGLPGYGCTAVFNLTFNRFHLDITSPKNVKELVDGVTGDKELLQSAGIESRYWMETFYHPKDILNRYFEFYRE